MCVCVLASLTLMLCALTATGQSVLVAATQPQPSPSDRRACCNCRRCSWLRRVAVWSARCRLRLLARSDLEVTQCSVTSHTTVWRSPNCPPLGWLPTELVRRRVTFSSGTTGRLPPCMDRRGTRGRGSVLPHLQVSYPNLLPTVLLSCCVVALLSCHVM